MASRIKKVAIIGAGICGVSSAICLQQADPTLELTIISEQFSPNLTSDGAAGFWEPVFLKDTPIDKRRRWGKATFEYIRSIIDTEEACKYQTHYITAYALHDQPIEKPPLSDIFLYHERLSKQHLKQNFPADIIDGFVMKSIIFPGTPYLNIKLKEFQQKGGKVIQKKVHSFDELAGQYDVVVNCTGLGARELCNDNTVSPVRGQVLKMRAPWLKHAYFIKRESEAKQELKTYIFPRFNDIVVGGSMQSDNLDTTINEKETQAMIERAAEFEPTIKNAVLIKAWVGLRPIRDSIRVEREIMQVSSKYGTKTRLQAVAFLTQPTPVSGVGNEDIGPKPVTSSTGKDRVCIPSSQPRVPTLGSLLDTDLKPEIVVNDYFGEELERVEQELANATTWGDFPVEDRKVLIRQVLRSRASSTVKKYVREHRKYISFPVRTRRPTTLPSDKLHIASYLAYVSQTKNSYNAVLQAFCGIKWVHSLLPTDVKGNPADTTLSANIVEASRRAFTKPSTKKEPISTSTITKVCQLFAGPSCTLKGLRTALIFSLGFTGLFRVSELLDIKAQDIGIQAEHLEIVVRKSKTDQYRQGNIVYIAKTNGPACPHALLLRFYSLTGIQPRSNEYIFRSLSSLKKSTLNKADNKPLSYSRCREIVKETLAAVGEDPAQFGTHSLRSGGATAIAESMKGIPGGDRLLRLQGRWKSDTSRDMYIKDSMTNRLSVTKSLQL